MIVAVLINRKGQEEATLPLPDERRQIVHNGKVFGFGTAKLSGEWYFYDVTPETPPMGREFEPDPFEAPPLDQEPVLDNPGYRPCNCEDYPCCGH